MNSIPALSEILASVQTPDGRKRLEKILNAKPYPHFRAVTGEPDLMQRVEQDGTSVIGTFINREFVAIEQTDMSSRNTSS